MGDSEILTPLINSQDSLSSQDQIPKPENTNAWGRLYPENECLKIEGLSIQYCLNLCMIKLLLYVI